MKRKIKIIIIGIIMFSILSTISYSMEPHGWTPDEGMYGFAEKHYSNINGFCVFFNKYNYTESQGEIPNVLLIYENVCVSFQTP